MLSKERINQFKNVFSQNAAQLRVILEERQAEIERETGVKPTLEELFAEIKNGVAQSFHTSEMPARNLFPQGLPGIRLEGVLGYFIPDIPLLLQIPDWEYGFYPKSLSEQEIESLTNLYLDLRFQRLSHQLPGRLAIIACNEEIAEADLFAQIGLPDDEQELMDFFEVEENPSTTQVNVVEKLAELYGQQYGLSWILNNEPPTGTALLRARWTSGFALSSLWWSKTGGSLAANHQLGNPSVYPHGVIDKKLNWLYHLPKFKKLSSSLHGRMDIICRIELLSREQMSDELELDEEILDHPEEHHEEIVEQLLFRFGDEYGALWLAYGLCGLDEAFVYQELLDNHAFLRQVPALFRKTGRTYISYAAAKAENRFSEEKRECVNCGNPVKGRIDKQFCCGACQRIYYYHKQNGQVLEGISSRSSEDEQEVEDVKPEPKVKSGLEEFMDGPIGQIASGVVKAFVDRGMNALGDELFGVKKDSSN
ncbi:MAG: hypothetical protein ACK5Z2_00180 [Bacteroidota bacterium]|jgi:hypothetical protein